VAVKVGVMVGVIDLLPVALGVAEEVDVPVDVAV